MEKAVLSKSTFIRGVQCLKSLYLYKKRYFLRDRLPPERQIIFARGHAVGNLAQQLFPGGVDVKPKSPRQFSKSLEKTKMAIEGGAEIIYEAGFQYDGVLVFLDLLVKQNGRWFAFEVKSSKAISETFIMDASLQYYVITNAGVDLEDISIIYINTDYIRQEKLDIGQLFTSESVLDQVMENQAFVEEYIKTEKAVVTADHAPKIPIGKHCYSPYACDFIGHCWRLVPDESVFSIPAFSDDEAFHLNDQGILNIEDLVSGTNFTDTQNQQINCHQKHTAYFAAADLHNFIAGISYPIHYVKLMVMRQAVPIYPGTKPYQAVVYGYAVASISTPGANVVSATRVADQDSTPITAIHDLLMNELSDMGSVVVYEQDELFEELLQSERQNIKYKIVDLSKIFSKNLYYNPDLKGDNSLGSIASQLKLIDSDKFSANNDFILENIYVQGLQQNNPLNQQDAVQQISEYAKNQCNILIELHNYLISKVNEDQSNQ